MKMLSPRFLLVGLALLFTVVTAACASHTASPATSTQLPPLVSATPTPAVNEAANSRARSVPFLETGCATCAVAAGNPGEIYGYSTGGSATVNDAPYDATFFKHYGVNPFIDTQDDNLSTFAMDVDTASYTVARRFITDGHLPDPDSVRVEEFINYFRQDYLPAEDGAFAIHTEGAPSFFGGPNHWLMRVGLQGRTVSAEERKDASLVFVIDVSGSMAMENRLGLVKRSLRLLVNELRPTDQIGIVVYGSQARVVLRPTSGENKSAILGAIEELAPGGSTNAEEGLRLGYRMAREALDPKRINRLILLSDGVANVGNTGPDSILKSVRDSSADGLTLSTVGFGMGNFNDVLMEQLANDGDGTYAYVDTISEARRIFVENLTGTLQVIARDAKVQVDFNPEVVSRFRLLGYENRRVADQDFRNDSVDAGEVGAGHSVTALYELKLLPGVEGRVATVNVRYEDPDTGDVMEISREFYRGQISAAFEEASPRFQLDAAVAEYAEILRESYWALEGSMEDVSAVAGQVSRLLPDDPDVTEFLYLVTQAASIIK
ncbi:MAG: von Willebrand factor type A domain-containing protein [Chloroflexi bacterium]|nr:von Willebrand factor type A domain-containing protein [Chloroflexota bacterium]